MIEALPTENLSFVADALLALVGPERDAPYATEAAWERKETRMRRREVGSLADDSPLFASLAEKADGPLLARECAEVISSCGLTPTQRLVLNLRMEGYSFEQIGQMRHTTKQGAMNVFVQGLRKVGRTLRAYPYRGLDEVYRTECRSRARRYR